MNRFKFSAWDSIDAEMKRFTTIRESDPIKGKRMFVKGELLVSLAEKGEMYKIRKFIEETDSEDLLMYFVYKALKKSLIGGHLMVSSYIIDCGYPINHDGLPFVVHECLLELEDYLCVAIIRMLASKGLDLNRQVNLITIAK